MNKPKFVFKSVLFLVALSATNAFAQTENKSPAAEPCYEIILQVLTASNAASDKNGAAPALAGVVRKLKTLYAFSDYRLTETYLQRTSNSIEYKGLMNDSDSIADKSAPLFSEWSLRNLRAFGLNSGSRQSIQFDSFRFGARVPITISSKSEDGKSPSVISYDSIGITSSRFTVKENEPTVIGSLATAKADELMFLVLTVKAVE